MGERKTHTLDRTALYELVWDRPRTELAKQFELSDVAIAKHCRKANIPMPPPGYWVRVKNGSKLGARPSLPIRRPGQSKSVTLGADDRYFRPITDDKLFERIDSPTFEESVDEIVNPAIAEMGKLVAQRDLSNPHPGLNKVLDSERRKREQHLKTGYSYDKPLFDEDHFQRQLRIFNSLIWGVSRVGGSGYVYRSDEWIYGHGTICSLQAVLVLGEVSVCIHFEEPTSPKKAKNSPYAATTTLRAGFPGSGANAERWTDEQGNRLEKKLTDIACAALLIAETKLREHALSNYEWLMKRRDEKLAEKTRIADAERQRRQEEQAKHKKKARDALLGMASDYRQAQDIRTMVGILSAQLKVDGEDTEGFERWTLKVLQFADSIDPTRLKLSEILDSTSSLFELDNLAES